jgi:hypothetical protein
LLLRELAELALPLVAEEAHAHYIFSKMCLLIGLEAGESLALLCELAELALPLVTEEAHAHYIFSKFCLLIGLEAGESLALLCELAELALPLVAEDPLSRLQERVRSAPCRVHALLQPTEKNDQFGTSPRSESGSIFSLSPEADPDLSFALLGLF